VRPTCPEEHRRQIADGLRHQVTRIVGYGRACQVAGDGLVDFDLELPESRTLDGRTQELTYRPTLH
jgi:hypothetical protein